MKKIFFILIAGLVFLFAGCTEERKDDAAAVAAKDLYESLLSGDPASFVRGMYLPDSIPDNYREQLESNMKMFLARMNEEHKGIKKVKILNYVNDTIVSEDKKESRYVSDVFLLLNFGDSLNEEIVVRMVEHKGRWLMK